MNHTMRMTPAVIGSRGLWGAWALVVAGSAVYCSLYEIVRGRPLVELVPWLQWGFKVWAGWILLSLALRNPRVRATLAPLMAGWKGRTAVVLLMPAFALICERLFDLVYAQLGWWSNGEPIEALILRRAPLYVVAPVALVYVHGLLGYRHGRGETRRVAELVEADPSVQAATKSGSAAGQAQSTAPVRALESVQIVEPVRAIEQAHAAASAHAAAPTNAATPSQAVQPIKGTPPAATNGVHADTITVPTSRGPMIIPVRDIEAIVAAENYVEICLSDGKQHLHRATLQSIGESLNGAAMIRVRRSAIVNLIHLREQLTGRRLRLTSGRIVRVGRTFKDRFDQEIASRSVH